MGMAIRWKPTLETPSQYKSCDRQRDKKEIRNCWLNAERENFNWEKHQVMLDYLRSTEGFTHILMDADAALVHQTHNTMELMVGMLQSASKDLLLTNEDWI